MPELPEVEIVRRGLLPALEGKAFRSVEQHRPDLRFPLPTDFPARLSGRSVEPAALPDDYGERRIREQRALIACLTDLAASRPLVILIDDFHRADEASAAMLAWARPSCTAPRAALTSSTAPINAASSGWPMASETAAAAIRR